MLQPNIRKFPKKRKVRASGISTRNLVSYGTYGIKAVQCGRINRNQIESVRVAINRKMKQEKASKLFIRCFPHLPISKKPLAVRMGGGKGPVETYVSAVQAGAILFEIANVTHETAMIALQSAMYKLPFDCKIVQRKFLAK